MSNDATFELECFGIDWLHNREVRSGVTNVKTNATSWKVKATPWQNWTQKNLSTRNFPRCSLHFCLSLETKGNLNVRRNVNRKWLPLPDRRDYHNDLTSNEQIQTDGIWTHIWGLTFIAQTLIFFLRKSQVFYLRYEEQRHLIFQSGRIGPPQLDRRGVVTSTHFELLGSTFLRLPLIEAPLHHNDFQRSKMVPGFRNRYNEPGFQVRDKIHMCWGSRWWQDVTSDCFPRMSHLKRSGLANNDEESLGYLRDDWVVCFCCCLHRKCSGLEECSG